MQTIAIVRVAIVRFAALTLSLTAASQAFAIECFSMYDTKNALVYQSSTTPIDLSRSISDQMSRRFPTRSLVISDLGSCPETGVTAAGTATQAAALLPGRMGDGTGVFGADTGNAIAAGATSPAPSSGYARGVGEVDATRIVTRAPGGRR